MKTNTTFKFNNFAVEADDLAHIEKDYEGCYKLNMYLTSNPNHVCWATFPNQFELESAYNKIVSIRPELHPPNKSERETIVLQFIKGRVVRMITDLDDIKHGCCRRETKEVCKEVIRELETIQEYISKFAKI